MCNDPDVRRSKIPNVCAIIGRQPDKRKNIRQIIGQRLTGLYLYLQQPECEDIFINESMLVSRWSAS